MSPLPFRAAAFSLVEVTLALGVAAFCLVAVFGLLPVGLNSNHASIEQTVANGILSAAVADLRATPPTTPPGQTVTSKQFSIPIPANPVAGSPAVTTLYINGDGQTNEVSQSRYRLTVAFLPNSSSKTATLASLKVSWPATADPSINTAVGSAQVFVALDRN